MAVRSIPRCTYKSDPYYNQKMDANWHIMHMKNMGIDILSFTVGRSGFLGIAANEW